MCLDRLCDDKPFQERGEGWKVFIRLKNGKLCGDYKAKWKHRPERVWLDSDDYGRARKIEIENPSLDDEELPNRVVKYPAGWHIFLEQHDAKHWAWSSQSLGTVIKKVRFKQVVAWGFQNTRKVVVAKKMFIYKGKGKELKYA